MDKAEIQVRRGRVEDAADVARLLHGFNVEYDEPAPSVEALTERLAALFAAGEITVLLAGGGPDGLALLRFRAALWADGLEAYLQELYVVPALRGRGIGRALLSATMDAARERGAAGIDLNTGAADTAARALYESSGFTNLEGGPGGPAMLFYERDL